MNASPMRDDWMPPQERGWGRSLLLALLAHAVLFAGLAWVTRWTTQAVVSAEAELWASVPVYLERRLEHWRQHHQQAITGQGGDDDF